MPRDARRLHVAHAGATLRPMLQSSAPPRRVRAPVADRSWLPVFAVALAVRLAYAWVAAGPHAEASSDAAEYATIATHLARGLGFSLGDGASVYPTAFVPPVVPWLTSLVYRVTGPVYLRP